MEPTFVTHDLNYRRHDLWDQELATSILERGIVPGVSGESWSQYSKDCSMPLRSISWGSRTNVFYIAHKKQPESKIIKKELENGLVTTRFHDLMPKAVVDFLVSFHNTFHKGAGVSFLDVQADAPALEQEWRSFCKESGQTVRGIGAGRYEATMMAYIMKAGGDKLDNAEQYNNAKAGTRSNWKLDKQSVDPVHLRISIDVAYDVIMVQAFRHRADNLRLYPASGVAGEAGDTVWMAWDKICRSGCDFLSPNLDKSVVLSQCKHISLISVQHKGYLCEEDLALVTFEALKFTVPPNQINHDKQRRRVNRTYSHRSKRYMSGGVTLVEQNQETK